MFFTRILFFLMLFLQLTISYAEIRVRDDLGRDIVIPAPAKKIISLAPHVTELLYAAGASNQLTGAVDFSDYPEVAKQIPRVGSHNKFDMEAIVAMNPDLIVAWKSGNPDEQIDELVRLGFNVF